MGEEVVVVSADRIISVKVADFRNSLDYSELGPVSNVMLESGEPCRGPPSYHIVDHCSFHVVSRILFQYA